nr:hypothetical protein [uncultured Prevotella sp.]
MQNSILIQDAIQAKPAGIQVNVNEGLRSLKCATKRELKRLSKTKSETFSILCDEEVTYGEVVIAMIGCVALMAIVAVSGYFFGGEVM